MRARWPRLLLLWTIYGCTPAPTPSEPLDAPVVSLEASVANPEPAPPLDDVDRGLRGLDRIKVAEVLLAHDFTLFALEDDGTGLSIGFPDGSEVVFDPALDARFRDQLVARTADWPAHVVRGDRMLAAKLVRDGATDVAASKALVDELLERGRDPRGSIAIVEAPDTPIRLTTDVDDEGAHMVDESTVTALVERGHVASLDCRATSRAHSALLAVIRVECTATEKVRMGPTGLTSEKAGWDIHATLTVACRGAEHAHRVTPGRAYYSSGTCSLEVAASRRKGEPSHLDLAREVLEILLAR